MTPNALPTSARQRALNHEIHGRHGKWPSAFEPPFRTLRVFLRFHPIWK